MNAAIPDVYERPATSHGRTFGLTSITMIAFAGNSLLCRAALKHTSIDAATFTSVRIISGAIALWVIVRARRGSRVAGGSWRSAAALFVYAAAFSFAYVSLPAASGALLLFGAVQATMIGYAIRSGERLRVRQWGGLIAAIGGLVVLLLPGLSAPPLSGSLLMLSAGAAWGIYSLRGRGASDPASVTAGNFARAALMAVVLSAATTPWSSFDPAGVSYAIVSGAVASGVGYAIWYTALRGLNATSAATVQLSVPVIAGFGGVVLLGESVTPRLLLASAAILGGIALVILNRRTHALGR